MVLLKYQSDGERLGSWGGAAAPSSSKKEEGKPDEAKTAFIDKLYKFREDDADEEKCDLFFICQDGDEVPAHRLVISNSSKYIMAMQDDQPPWYPVYISVPDLSKEIVQTLVQLAYTGQMSTPPGVSLDELVDAMQALGWIHTDCLSLTETYTDSLAPVTDEDSGTAGFSKAAESLETVLKNKFPANRKAGAESSDDDAEEAGMEVDLPAVPISDDEDGELTSNSVEKTPTKKVPQNSVKGRRSARKTNAVGSNSTPPKRVSASPSPRATRKKASPAVETKTVEELIEDESEVVEPVKPKRGRKSKVEKEAISASSTSTAEVEPASTQEPEAIRSRTRTIRKPKKFDDLIVLTPTKRKDSSPAKTTPTKSPTKVANSKPAEEIESKKPSNSAAVKKANATESTASKALPKSRRSTSSEKNTLITSYFTKKNASSSASVESVVDTVENNIELEPAVQNSDEGATSDKLPKSRKSSRLEDKSDNVEENQNDIDTTEEKTNDIKENDVGTSSSTLRRRAKSTASSKSDKDAGPVEASNSNHTDSEGTKTAAGRRKRNLQESEEGEEPEGESNGNGEAIPAKRGRKPSTISNASKSSKASNKETLDGDLDDAENAPKRKRTRQE